MQNRPPIPSWLYRMLGQVSGLTVTKNKDESLTVAVKGGHAVKFDIIKIPVLSKERAAEFKEKQRWSPANSTRAPLIATRQLANATRKVLREAELSWVEEMTGICHICGPGLLVDTRIQDISERRKTSAIQAKLRARSGLVAEILLTQFQRERIFLKDVAAKTKVSPGLASRVLSRLKTLNLLELYGGGSNKYWKMVDPGGILDLWAEEELKPERITNLYIWTRSLRQLIEKLPELHHLEKAWAIGGMAAANIYAPAMTTEPIPTVWIDAQVPAKEVASFLGGNVVTQGFNLQIWQSQDNLPLRFANILPISSEDGPNDKLDVQLVSTARAYVEAVTGAGRAPDAAQALREKILAP